MTERTNQIINNDNARSKKNKKNEFIESVGVFGVMEFFLPCKDFRPATQLRRVRH